MEMALRDGEIGSQEGCEFIQHLGQQRCVGPPFCQTRYYVLIVIGEISTDYHLELVKQHIKRGILSWEIDLTICDLNKELTLFETKHSAQFSSEVKGGSHGCPALYGNHFHCFKHRWKVVEETEHAQYSCSATPASVLGILIRTLHMNTRASACCSGDSSLPLGGIDCWILHHMHQIETRVHTQTLDQRSKERQRVIVLVSKKRTPCC